MAREPETIAEQRRELGAKLATFRLAAGLTQAQLADAVSYDRTTLAHLEKGRGRADERFWHGADYACRAGGVLVAAFNELAAIKAEHEQQTRAAELSDIEHVRGSSSRSARMPPAWNRYPCRNPEIWCHRSSPYSGRRRR